MNILLIDDHPIYRRGMFALLSEVLPGARVGEAESVEQALSLDLARLDLVLLDIGLPGINGLDGIALLRARWPEAAVLVLSALNENEAMSEALACGAVGFVSKVERPERILERMHEAIGNRKALPTRTVRSHEYLTPRQREVLGLLCQGLTNKIIARQLSLSENTVRRHVQDILEYFQVESRSQAVLAARRRGLEQ